MSNQDRNQAGFLAKFLWDKDNPAGRIIATIILIFLGPIGWFCAACLWGGYFLDRSE